jgi:mono/diheme cytochrome c family protein
MRWVYLGFAAALIVGVISLGVGRLGTTSDVSANPQNRQLVAQGRLIYGQHCASCHGANLEGQPNWKQELPEGGRPAPPHDASGHTWHHADKLLFEIVKIGPASSTTPGYIYRMPAFGDTLSDDQIWAVLAYIKSTWPPDIQAAQDEVNRQAP